MHSHQLQLRSIIPTSPTRDLTSVPTTLPRIQEQHLLAPTTKKLKLSKVPTKAGSTKKLKRYNPYESRIHITEDWDETHLMDTPILLVEEKNNWAEVACSQNPPTKK